MRHWLRNDYKIREGSQTENIFIRLNAEEPPFYLAKRSRMPWFARHCFCRFFLHLTVRGRRALSSAWWRFTQMITRLRRMALRKNRCNRRAVEHHCVCCEKGKTVADIIISFLKFSSLVKNLNEPNCFFFFHCKKTRQRII